MKKSILAVALLAASCGLAFAHGGSNGNNGYGNQGPTTNAGVVIVGGQGFAGDVVGSASSVTQGSAVAGSQVEGNGYSFQAAGAISGGSAQIGGQVGPSGATVTTSTTNYAVTGGFGATNQPATNGDGLITNGNDAFGSSVNNASGSANFQTGAFGGIAGFASIENISSPNH